MKDKQKIQLYFNKIQQLFRATFKLEEITTQILIFDEVDEQVHKWHLLRKILKQHVPTFTP